MTWFKGALGGFAISLIVLAAVQYHIPEQFGLLGVIHFLTAPITFLATVMASGLTPGVKPTAQQLTLVYFAYWLIMGAFLGWWFGYGKVRKMAGVILLAGVLFLHYQAMFSVPVKDVAATPVTVTTTLFRK